MGQPAWPSCPPIAIIRLKTHVKDSFLAVAVAMTINSPVAKIAKRAARIKPWGITWHLAKPRETNKQVRNQNRNQNWKNKKKNRFLRHTCFWIFFFFLRFNKFHYNFKVCCCCCCSRERQRETHLDPGWTRVLSQRRRSDKQAGSAPIKPKWTTRFDISRNRVAYSNFWNTYINFISEFFKMKFLSVFLLICTLLVAAQATLKNRKFYWVA